MNLFFEQSLLIIYQIVPELKHHCQEYILQSNDPDCIIPTDITHQYALMAMKKDHKNQHPKSYYAQFATQLSALCNWQYTKSIYRFDETLLHELFDQKLDVIPIQLLYRLPESSFFIEIPSTLNLVQKYLGNGFFVQYNRKGDACLLRLTFWEADKTMSALELPLDRAESMTRMIARILKRYPKTITIADRSFFEKRLRMTLNLILYLCAENTDYSGRKKPQKPSIYKCQKSAHYHKIGAKAGNLIRQYNKQVEKSKLHGKIRPHMRSAHWHTYWTGTGRIKHELLWIHPIFVNKDTES